MALSLSPEGFRYLKAHEWQGNISYRFLTVARGYSGRHRLSDRVYDRIGAQIEVHSVDVQATYAVTDRISGTLTMPFVSGWIASRREHGGVNSERRRTTRAYGLGDLRLVGTTWALDPGTHPEGNFSLGAGVKFPTGDHEASDVFHKPTGDERRPVDSAIQPGDGGFGAILELQAFQKLVGDLYAYTGGYYLINPRERNGTPTSASTATNRVENSVPDQYLGRVGLSYALWPEKGLSASVGGRIDGIPVYDLIGGSDGFRRPGYAVYIEPGISWTYRRAALSVYVPVAIERNREKSVIDKRVNPPVTPGGFADYLVVASLELQL
ncbi:MAG: hypothetical protein HY721_06770 [Planctomycetes bacterium]|nr:hypothetical protein [Planctomycetota bacterium]